MSSTAPNTPLGQAAMAKTDGKATLAGVGA